MSLTDFREEETSLRVNDLICFSVGYVVPGTISFHRDGRKIYFTTKNLSSDKKFASFIASIEDFEAYCNLLGILSGLEGELVETSRDNYIWKFVKESEQINFIVGPGTQVAFSHPSISGSDDIYGTALLSELNQPAASNHDKNVPALIFGQPKKKGTLRLQAPFIKAVQHFDNL